MDKETEDRIMKLKMSIAEDMNDIIAHYPEAAHKFVEMEQAKYEIKKLKGLAPCACENMDW